jgi:phosphoglycerate dehydrogenase-like enzyme
VCLCLGTHAARPAGMPAHAPAFRAHLPPARTHAASQAADEGASERQRTPADGAARCAGVSLVGKTLAVMGFGKVGADVARRAKGLGMHVIAHDPYAPEEKARAVGVKLVTFDEALRTADFLSLHMPLTSGTKNMFNKEAFAKCKRGCRIVNVARGGVIDESDLVEAVESGQVRSTAHTFRTFIRSHRALRPCS